MKIRIRRKKIIKEAAKGPQDLDENTKVTVYVTDGYARVSYSGNVNGSITAKTSCTFNGIKVFEVDTAFIDDKYGPLLYDVMMEALYKEYKAALAPSREMVSDDAKAVWDFYLEYRTDDVKELRLDVDAETLAFYYDSPPFSHLTKTTADDCGQGSSLEHAANVGDWTKIPGDVRRDGVKYQPHLAKNWHKESVSYAYIKKNEQAMEALGDKLVYNAVSR